MALEMGPMLRDTNLVLKPAVLLANALAALALNLVGSPAGISTAVCLADECAALRHVPAVGQERMEQICKNHVAAVMDPWSLHAICSSPRSHFSGRMIAL